MQAAVIAWIVRMGFIVGGTKRIARGALEEF